MQKRSRLGTIHGLAGRFRVAFKVIICKGFCNTGTLFENHNPTMYYRGVKWCSTCQKGISNVKSCPCCHGKLRQSPTKTKGRYHLKKFELL